MPICASCGHETAEDANFCPKCGARYEAAARPREVRKTVTVVFCDITGSTELGESADPEALRALLARYFEQMKRIVEAHGGSVEKFIGDAVMAVFGVPVSHEDDALRACRAAVAMRDVLPELGIAGRVGVNTGEVVTGTEERLATGDAVNVAARLEQAAAPGEILIGAQTLTLVAGAVDVGDERRLDLKGKSELVPAYPLLSATGELKRRFGTPMVGRGRELQGLRDAYARAEADRSCQLFTILGSAGVGKSRLVAEFLSTVDAGVVQGRCLSYGEGITYWPVVEILKQLDALPEGPAAQPLRSLLGESDLSASAEEIAWGFRKLLEQEAQARPLVVVFDDLHWAEETLLDLVEHAADLLRGAPLLLLCMARPELLDRRPSWGGGKWNAATVLLEPLDATETEQLLAELGALPPELHGRIVQVAEGNPLFLEEMLALVRDSGGERVEVPATIQALLAARLDQLDPAERTVLEHGSVEGRTFHRGAVAALGDEGGSVDQRLVALVRKELVRPDRARLAGDDAYRFRHLLIRDAAYDALPKAVRADLHRRFAEWLGEHGQSLVELDEVVGYHLEQAARYLEELGRPDPELALAAGDRLAVAGKRAQRRADSRAAGSLLERSLELTRPHRLDVHTEVALVQSFVFRDTKRGVEIADAIARRAEASGDSAGAAHARTVFGGMRLHAGIISADELEQTARAALPLLEAAGDHEGMRDVWLAVGLVANMRSHYEEWAQASEHAIAHARAAGPDSRTWGLGVALARAPRPAAEALAALEAALSGQPNPIDLMSRGVLLAMLGRIDEAWEIALPAYERTLEMGGGEVHGIFLAEIAEIAGDHEAAVLYLGRACDAYEASGNTSVLSSYAPLLGRLLCALGRYEEADPLAAKGRELGDPDDVLTQAQWRRTEALVKSHRGEHQEAEQLARESVEWSLRSDSPLNHGDSYSILAEVLEAAGRREEAIEAWQEAIEAYARKGIVPLVRRARERLASLEPA